MIIPETAMTYPGDADFSAFLETHDCPISLTAVKFRLWGQVTTVATAAGPEAETRTIWGDALPAFDSAEESMLFSATFMSLWNELRRVDEEGKYLKLPPRTGIGDLEGLKRMVEARLDALSEGYFTGFLADLRGFDFGYPAVDNAVSRLGDMIEEVEYVAEQLDEAPSTFAQQRRRFIRLDGKAQRKLDAIVDAARSVHDESR
ncbi:hypothetical protein [Martelella mangrovi]|uniref:Poly(3-hydroxyalkanoate) polymerase subunit PhaE n=1 Tax=Martelella mangrovi TaxID=1397477 RepID=A0ABV2IB81_9HYPH